MFERKKEVRNRLISRGGVVLPKLRGCDPRAERMPGLGPVGACARQVAGREKKRTVSSGIEDRDYINSNRWNKFD